MCVKLKDMSDHVSITGSFAGTYRRGSGTSYYLNGTDKSSEIHFTVSGNPDSDFRKFHISHPVGSGGMNGREFYFRGTPDTKDDQDQHLPTTERKEWEAWIAKNRADCNAAATEFWNALNTCTQ